LSSPLLHVHLQAGYGGQQLLHDIRFDLQPGERLGLVGASGAGKSTLALALLGLLPWRGGWAKGEVLLAGINLLSLREREARKLRGRQIALVPQSATSALNGSLSLLGHFEEAWRAHEDAHSSRFRQRVTQLMRQVQLPTGPQFLARKPGEISVGQAQRVVIALALLHRPALLLADEPTSALDPCTQSEVLDLLRSAGEQDDTSLLYISHDLLSVLQLCRRMAVLDAGRIVECLDVHGLEEQARHAATLALLRSLPVPASVVTAHAPPRSIRILEPDCDIEALPTEFRSSNLDEYGTLPALPHMGY
jgi:ABC-type glutathione transport system ATPase component